MNSITAFHLLVQEAPILLSIVVMMFIIGVSFYRSFVYVSLACLIVLLFFFRNPTRTHRAVLTEHDSIVAPADGKIVGIAYDPSCAFDGYYYKVSIVVSLFDVHINRAAASGEVASIQYVPGNHVMFCNPNRIKTHEYADVEIIGSKNHTYKIRQTAGTFARRVACWPKVGDTIKTGQIYGMVLFGSRVELFLPQAVRLSVGVGQHIKAGATTLGHWVD